jgi:uncharacterized protein DUF4864
MRWKPVVAGLALILVLGAMEVTQNRVTRSDLVEIRTVISRQIEAFRRDDAQGAFALVSPDVQHSFGTEHFLHVVRTTYRAVYRPANLSFLDLVVIGGEVVQQIHVTDHAGGLWVAYFSMQRQRDGSWRMNGCHLLQSVRTISA